MPFNKKNLCSLEQNRSTHINTSLTAANKTLTDVNKEREKVLNNWDAASKKFMESHLPRGN